MKNHRDFQFWNDKHGKAVHESTQLRAQILMLESWEKRPIKRRLSGYVREIQWRRWSNGVALPNGKSRTNSRQYNYRSYEKWARAHKHWLIQVTKLAKMRKRKKMLDDTKIPYYLQRIWQMGREPTNLDPLSWRD
jgi:hypothetical protein